jgi:REP element-mobilizing transposase RayT
MPRRARASQGGFSYHVLNRGNSRREVFLKDGDYAAFLNAMADGCAAVPMRVVGYWLMPNHFHRVLWPHADGDLSRWMRRLTNTHVRRVPCPRLCVGMGCSKTCPPKAAGMALGFSKKKENLDAAIALYLAPYNFSRLHGTLKGTPAMRAGLAGHPSARRAGLDAGRIAGECGGVTR